MNDKFFALPDEKQNAILNGAMSVFAQYDYKKATVDEIASRAGISKGLLFFYFENKKGLYLYLYEYAVNFLKREMAKDYDWSETDFFQILVKSQNCKLKVIKQHPNLFGLIIKVYYEKDSAVEATINYNFAKILADSSAEVVRICDKTKFKDGVDIAMLLNLIVWASDGLMRIKTYEGFDGWDALNEEFMTYIQFLKNQCYKEEYL